MKLVEPAYGHPESYAAALRRGWSPDTLRAVAALEELERIPGLRRWMRDAESCGSIGLRRQHGTTELSPHCLGHIGFSVVPGRRREALATAALARLLSEAWALGSAFVELTTSPENTASQRVIRANGGVFVERFAKPAELGSTPSCASASTVRAAALRSAVTVDALGPPTRRTKRRDRVADS